MKVAGKKNDYSGLIKKRKEYIVLGIYIPQKYGDWMYLISASGGWPYWESSQYFDVIDNDILPDWHMKIYDPDDPQYDLFCLSGFSELCNNSGYFEALAEREKWALDIYSKRYKEAVEWYDMKPFITKKSLYDKTYSSTCI